MRAVANLFLAVLLLGALLWGNCLSCPELLLALSSHAPAHGCCKRPDSSGNECHSVALKHFVKADPAQQTAIQFAPCSPMVTRLPAPPVTPVRLDTVPAIQQSPPGLDVLNSVFRI